MSWKPEAYDLYAQRELLHQSINELSFRIWKWEHTPVPFEDIIRVLKRQRRWRRVKLRCLNMRIRFHEICRDAAQWLAD